MPTYRQREQNLAHRVVEKLTNEGGNARAMSPNYDPAGGEDGVMTYAGRKAYADRLDFQSMKRGTFIAEFTKALRTLNEFVKHRSEDGVGIWPDAKFESLLSSKSIFLGSSEHLFNLSDIEDDVYAKHKKWTGDLDIAVPQGRVKILNRTLEGHELLKLSDKFTFVGRNRSPVEGETSSCIFAYHADSAASPVFVQVDFMSLDFNDLGPDDFSRFIRSSPWDDIKAGIKGVFHKYLLASVTNAVFERENVSILTPSSIKKGLEKGTDHFKVSAMSPEHGRASTHTIGAKGLRNSIEPVNDPAGNQYRLPGERLAFRKLETHESINIRDLTVIFQKIFSKEPSGDDLRRLSSFVGLIDLIEENVPGLSEKIFIKFVAGKLFGSSSQALYASDPETDRAVKMACVDIFLKKFPSLQGKMDFVEKLIKEYYENYRIRSTSNESLEISSNISNLIVGKRHTKFSIVQLRKIIRESIARNCR